MNNRRSLVLLGPPASGKGTQAQRIAAWLDAPIIATGRILRDAIASGSPLGIQAQGYLESGTLVPDECVVALVDNAAAQLRTPYVILDGFPRTVAQAQSLERFLPPQAVLSFDLSVEKVVERISGRRMGPNGESYHLLYHPPPPGLEVSQRKDDREEVVRERLRVYHELTEPILSFYEGRNLLSRVCGHGSIEEVFIRILPLLPKPSA